MWRRVVWFAAVAFPYLLVTLSLLAIMGGCASGPIRLGPGDCVVIQERYEIIVAGGDCRIQRLFR